MFMRDLAFINSANDLMLIALVVLIFFGANRIPEVMRGLGQGMRELKRGMQGEEESAPRAEDRRARLRAEVMEELRREREGDPISRQGG